MTIIKRLQRARAATHTCGDLAGQCDACDQVAAAIRDLTDLGVDLLEPWLLSALAAAVRDVKKRDVGVVLVVYRKDGRMVSSRSSFAMDMLLANDVRGAMAVQVGNRIRASVQRKVKR